MSSNVLARDIKLGDMISVAGHQHRVSYCVTTPLDSSTTIQAESPDVHRAVVSLSCPGDHVLKVTARAAEPAGFTCRVVGDRGSGSRPVVGPAQLVRGCNPIGRS